MEMALDVRGSWLLAMLGFAAGAIVGSFLATVLVRWPAGRSAATGRSKCDGCGAALGPLELVPILSYLFSRGRCRRCGERIDRRHLAVELVAALIGAAALLLGGWPLGAAGAILGWWLLILAALDIEHHWLPDRLTLPLIPAGLFVAAAGIGPPLVDRLIGAAAGFLLLWAIGAGYAWLRGREGLGGGDPKLFAAIGAWLGWQFLPFVMLGAGLLGLAALLVLRLRGSAVAATDRLPLGTLMAACAWPLWLLLPFGL
jgi:leader peptidase (prepilin peptidase)/N-methyltransferase